MPRHSCFVVECILLYVSDCHTCLKFRWMHASRSRMWPCMVRWSVLCLSSWVYYPGLSWFLVVTFEVLLVNGMFASYQQFACGYCTSLQSNWTFSCLALCSGQGTRSCSVLRWRCTECMGFCQPCFLTIVLPSYLVSLQQDMTCTVINVQMLFSSEVRLLRPTQFSEH